MMPEGNKWHDAVMFKKTDGGFAIFSSVMEAKESNKPLTDEWECIKWNFNDGNPKIIVGDTVYHIGNITQSPQS
jgi:hypothetical protein